MSDRSEATKRRLQIGRVRPPRVDDTGPVQRHQGEGLAGELLDGVERVTDYGFASHPLPGAEGVLAAVAGVRGQGLLVVVGDRRYRFPLDEGEVALFDDKGQSVHLSAEGIVLTSPIKVRVETPVYEVVADTILLDGDVKLGGDAGLKAVARHDDPVVSGKVVASATKARAK